MMTAGCGSGLRGRSCDDHWVWEWPEREVM